MKKLALILVMGTLVSFYADAGRKPCSGSKGGMGFEGQWNENVRLWYNLLIIIQYTKVPFQGPFRML